MGHGRRATLSYHAAAILLLLLIGLSFASTQGAHGMFMWDEAEYASLGRSLARDEGYTIDGSPIWQRLPILPLSVAASIRIAGGATDAIARAPILAWTVLTLLLLYGCVALSVDRPTALLASILLAAMPLFRSMSAVLLTEMPLMCSFTVAVYTFHLGLREDRRWLFVSWAAFGLALLTRYNGIFFLPIAGVYVLVSLMFWRPPTVAALTDRALWLAPAVALVLLAPWLLRQSFVFGDALAGFRQAPMQLPNYTAEWRPAGHYLVTLPEMLSWPILLLVAAGLAVVLQRRHATGILSLLAAATVIAVLSFFAHKQMRLVSSVLPFLATIAALGVTRSLLPLMAGGEQSSARSRRVAGAAIVLLIAAISVANYHESSRALRSHVTLGYPSFRRAMEWLRQHSDPADVVLCPNPPQVFWYAERSTLDYPGIDGFADVLHRAQWIVAVDFERGQPAYVMPLVEQWRAAELRRDDFVEFEDPLFQTVVIRSSAAAALLRATGGGEGRQPDP